MFDCGFSFREVQRRLDRAGCSPADLSALVVTHEHGDHASGIVTLARRYAIPVWMSYGTFQALGKDFSGVDLHFCRDGDRFAVGDLQISAFTVSHDAREPLQFHMTDGMAKLGVLTDTGRITAHIEKALSDCDALILECNYDDALLAQSDYPVSLKRRIRGEYGHLSNRNAAEFLNRMAGNRLKKVIGAHLSQSNNLPDLARQALVEAIGGLPVEVVIAEQETGFEWLTV